MLLLHLARNCCQSLANLVETYLLSLRRHYKTTEISLFLMCHNSPSVHMHNTTASGRKGYEKQLFDERSFVVTLVRSYQVLLQLAV